MIKKITNKKMHKLPGQALTSYIIAIFLSHNLSWDFFSESFSKITNYI